MSKLRNAWYEVKAIYHRYPERVTAAVAFAAGVLIGAQF